MKKLVLVLSLIAIFSFSYAQTTVISDESHSGDASAVLDVYSTSKGLLIPRVELTSTSDASTISSPATGLLVYDIGTNISAGYYYNSGTSGSPTWTIIGSFTLPSLTSGSVLFSDGSTVTQDNSNLFWNNASDRLGINTSSPSNSLSFGGDAARTISLERNTTTSGNNLNLQAGGALSGGTNLNGGRLYLKSGITTGTGRSDIYFQTPATGTSGTSDNALTSRMTLWGNGSISMGTSTWLTNVTLYVSGSGNTNQQSLYSYAENGTTENRAIWGKSQATGSSAENNYGVVGEVVKPVTGTTSGACYGLMGFGAGSSGKNYGVYGESTGAGAENIGVYGLSQTSTAVNYGMWGAAYGGSASLNIGIRGYSYGGTTGRGVEATASNSSSANYAFYGVATTAATTNYGLYSSASGATTNYSFYGNAGIMKNSGSLELPISSKTGAYTLTSSDYTVTGDASIGGFTITLPASSGISGRVYIIKNIGSSGTVTVDGNASETIDGATTYALSTQWSSIMIQSDNVNWIILSKN